MIEHGGNIVHDNDKSESEETCVAQFRYMLLVYLVPEKYTFYHYRCKTYFRSEKKIFWQKNHDNEWENTVVKSWRDISYQLNL